MLDMHDWPGITRQVIRRHRHPEGTHMNNDSSTFNISSGMDVVGSDGEKVGTISDLRGEYVVVSEGLFFPTDYYIPTSAFSRVDDGTIYLAVSRDETLNQGWDTEPATTSTASDTGLEPIVDPGLHIDNPVGYPDDDPHTP